jgi:hypothetical protein
MYENLIGPKWTTKGVSVSRPSHITGEYKELISGDGGLQDTSRSVQSIKAHEGEQYSYGDPIRIEN